MWNAPAEIAVHHAGGEIRRALGAPDDTVELLPGVAPVDLLKVQDGQSTTVVHHHVSDVVVAVLIGLGTAGQQMAAPGDILQKGFPALVFQGAAIIHGDFAVNLPVEADFPRLGIGRGGEGVELSQNPAGLQTVAILGLGRQGGDHRFRVLTVDPALDRIDALFAFSKLQRAAHGDLQRGSRLHAAKLPKLFIVLIRRGDTQQVSAAKTIACAVFPVPGPALVNGRFLSEVFID